MEEVNTELLLRDAAVRRGVESVEVEAVDSREDVGFATEDLEEAT